MDLLGLSRYNHGLPTKGDEIFGALNYLIAELS